MINEQLIPTIFHFLEAPVRGAAELLHFLLQQRDLEALVVFGFVFMVLMLLYRFVRARGRGATPPGIHPLRCWLTWRTCWRLPVFGLCLALLLLFLWQDKRGLPFTKAVVLSPKLMDDAGGYAFSYRLTNDEAGKMPKPGLVTPTENGLPLLRQVENSARVRAEGGGAYVFNGHILWFSSTDHSDPMLNGRVYKLHYPMRLSRWFLRSAFIFSIITFLFMVCDLKCRRLFVSVAHRFHAAWRGRIVPRTWGFWWPGLIVGTLFLVVFSGHQYRYRDQDFRMQAITSRPDDSLLMQRLRWVAEQKTMDPDDLHLQSYGAMSFIPMAAPVYVAAQLGFPVSDAFIHLSSRLVKTLLTTLTLLAVYALGALYFSRATGFIASAMLGTNLSLLTYTSYPFYPDAFMAGCNTVGLIYALLLIGKPDARHVFLAAFWCGLGFAIKFLAAISLPIILLCALTGRWRSGAGRWQALRGAFCDAVLACVVLGLAFVLFNPYLDYLSDWIIPNIIKAPQTYSSGAVIHMQKADPTLQDWFEVLAGQRKYDLPVLIAFFMATFCVLLEPVASWLGWLKLNASNYLARLMLLLLVWPYFFYLKKSITVGSAIDGRYFLLVWGLIYLLGFWFVFGVLSFLEKGIGRLMPKRIEAPSTKRFSRIASCVVVVLFFIARIDLTATWLSNWGRPLTEGATAKWLDEHEFPVNSHIVSGMQPYVPAKYPFFTGWRWVDLPNEFLKAYKAGVYIENKSYNEIDYMTPRSRADLRSDAEWEFYTKQRSFFKCLHSDKLFPFVYAGTGSEKLGANPGDPHLNFNVFVDRYLWTPNELSPENGAVLKRPENMNTEGENNVEVMFKKHAHNDTNFSSGLDGKWPQSVTIALAKPRTLETLRLTWSKPEWVASDFTVQGLTADEKWITLAKREGWHNLEGWRVTHERLLPRVPVKALNFTATKATGKDRLMLEEMAAFALAPQIYNNTALNFDIKERGDNCMDGHTLSEAFAERFDGTHFALVKPQEDSLSFHLEPKRPLNARRVLLVFRSKINLPHRVLIRVEFKGGTEQEIVLLKKDIQTKGAAHSFVEMPIDEENRVLGMDIKLLGNAGKSAFGLRQCYVEASLPLME